MNMQEHQRFDWLRQGPCVPFAYVRDYYELDWPPTGDLEHDYEKWVNLKKRRHKCSEDELSRYEIEAFMQEKSVVPKKWMAAQLGTDTASLDELLGRLPDIGMRPQRYVVYADLIDRSLPRDIVSSLPSLEFVTFSNHDSFCKLVHAELRDNLGIQLEPLFCATSKLVQDDPPRYASYFDCLTLDPVCGKHQLWLDFRKPLELAADRCSKLLYAHNREELAPYCAGTREPDDLEWYESFLAGAHHASDPVILDQR
ncbi:MAG: hypothetical protein KJ000_24570 [Pirellulaceae bacterium]|nr:hypothetical protein [Pirellulaceae bacterium]